MIKNFIGRIVGFFAVAGMLLFSIGLLIGVSF